MAAKARAPLAELGVIGGSGVYHIEELRKVRKLRIRTPFGSPSDAFILGELEGHSIAFLPRHGIGHRISPSELNFRANIFAMKLLGVKRVISVSAVGSMKEDLHPGHIVVPTQFFDRTVSRPRTFFSGGAVVHVSFADPVCPSLVSALTGSARKAGVTVHEGGTYLCIEGPQFSTRAESRIFRSWGVDVIGMTNLPEARLAREAELCYATLALVTDYDCWHESEDSVTVENVIFLLKQNADTAKSIVKALVRELEHLTPCSCGTALRDALLTDPGKIPPAVRRRLSPLIGKYLKS